jgi:hypothetical protein
MAAGDWVSIDASFCTPSISLKDGRAKIKEAGRIVEVIPRVDFPSIWSAEQR